MLKQLCYPLLKIKKRKVKSHEEAKVQKLDKLKISIKKSNIQKQTHGGFPVKILLLKILQNLLKNTFVRTSSW